MPMGLEKWCKGWENIGMSLGRMRMASGRMPMVVERMGMVSGRWRKGRETIAMVVETMGMVSESRRPAPRWRAAADAGGGAETLRRLRAGRDRRRRGARRVGRCDAPPRRVARTLRW
jgi:hypothetical protein